VLHQAALGSVPLSISDPKTTHDVNVSGFVNLLIAAKTHKVRRFVYASSCAIYGNNQNLPLDESSQLFPLSPYAASKACNEMYAKSFYNSYGLPTIGLRYFNVFGERQDPKGAYAAVIPRWIHAMLDEQPVFINGDGENTRDFVYVGTVVDSNIASALQRSKLSSEVFNIGSGESLSLNQLYRILAVQLSHKPKLNLQEVQYRASRLGDIRHSVAQIGKSAQLLHIEPISVDIGIAKAFSWYLQNNLN